MWRKLVTWLTKFELVRHKTTSCAAQYFWREKLGRDLKSDKVKVTTLNVFGTSWMRSATGRAKLDPKFLDSPDGWQYAPVRPELLPE